MADTVPSSSDRGGLPPVIARMLHADFYPHGVTSPVRLVQTHLSWVLLTGEFAYKVKKPVDFGFADFRTLERRRHFCEEELRLNRRGAPGVYLDVLPICKTGADETSLCLGGDGDPVEYALRMRQFPQEALFTSLLARGELDTATVVDLGRTLAAYHETSAADERIASFGELDRIDAVLQDNYRQAARFVGTLQTREQRERTRAWTDAFIRERQDLLRARVGSGRVRECHGDPHLGNLCRWDGRILLFDCIEFNEAFRFVDVMHDVAFVAMDLRAHGRDDLAAALVNTWAERTGDWEGLRLLALYSCRHAYVRAKVRSLLSEDPAADESVRRGAAAEAERYFRLAAEYTRPRAGRLLLVCGVSGSGKSTVSRVLAGRRAAVHLRSDAVRKHLGGCPLDARGGPELYTPEMTSRTYARLIATGVVLAAEGFEVILDAKFDRRILRQQAATAAAAYRVPVRIVHCVAPPDVLRQRVDARRGDITDATSGLLAGQLESWEDFSDGERKFVHPVDTTSPPESWDVGPAGT